MALIKKELAMTQTSWKQKLEGLLNICQDEVKKTTKIGQKMISASQTNTCLKESYEKLGELAFEALESKKISWDDKEAQELITKINECRNNLVELEEEVNKIKSNDNTNH